MLYHRLKKLTKSHKFQHQALTVLGPLWRLGTPSSSATHRNLFPNFTHLYLQLHHLPASPEETRLSLAWTPQCPKADALMGPEEIRLLTAATRARCLVRAGTFPAGQGRVRERAPLLLPANENMESKSPSQPSGDPAPEGSSASSIKLWKLKLK